MMKLLMKIAIVILNSCYKSKNSCYNRDNYEKIYKNQQASINYNNGNCLNNDNAIIPTRASKESAGLDLCSSIVIDIEAGSIKKVNTGICISLPENSYGSIRDKSSLESKGLLTLGGVIDSDYTGEIIVTMTSLIEPIKIRKGQKIAQLIVSNNMYPEIKKVNYLKEIERNDKGFGEMDKIDSVKKI